LLAEHGKAPLSVTDLRSGPNQFKVIIDICHLHGIAVLFDVVYNRRRWRLRRSGACTFWIVASFTAITTACILPIWVGRRFGIRLLEDAVRQFLIDNAGFFLAEYHVDGFRYDEMSVIDNHGGWRFCQDLTNTVRAIKPDVVQIGEYWNDWRWLSVTAPPAGIGCDATLADGLRESLRDALRQSSFGQSATVDLDAVRNALYPPYGSPRRGAPCSVWKNHDIVYNGREPRIAALADPNDAPILVRTLANTRCHGNAAHRAWHTAYIYGPGISRRQELER